MGVSVSRAKVRILGTKLSNEGPLLITHWGMSGPAILKLSAWGARTLFEMNYQFEAEVNWLPDFNEEKLRNQLPNIRSEIGAKKVNKNPFEIPTRLWLYLIEKAGINEEKRWGDLNKQELNSLIRTLIYDNYPVSGKTTFKEEFVTCGGISLKDVNNQTMESKKCPGMYFAGEVLDIDGITGGFNFQAAWTTGYVAGELGV